MKVKCLGGPHNQKYQWINDDLRYGDHHRIPRCLPSMSINQQDVALDAIAYEYDIYRLETLSTPKRKYKFLLYEKMTIEEIFDKIFT